jgi:hypothetical protein
VKDVSDEVPLWKALAGIVICVLAMGWLLSWAFLLLAVPFARQDEEPWLGLILLLSGWGLVPGVILGSAWVAMFRGVSLD